jgi:hypothetical protein
MAVGSIDRTQLLEASAARRSLQSQSQKLSGMLLLAAFADVLLVNEP